MPLSSVFSWLELFRPFEWTKTLTFMLIGAIYALYLNHQTLFEFSTFFLFIQGLLAVLLLWSASYALNDFSGYPADQRHPVKKSRPIPSGRIKPLHALMVSMLFLVFSLLLSFQLGIYFLGAILVMLVNQLLYTLPPFRFKDRPIVDIVGGSMVSPFFRFSAGYFLFQPTSGFTLFPFALAIGMMLLQSAAYTMYKLSSRSHEESLGVKNTFTLLPASVVKLLSYAGLVIGFLLLIYAFYFQLPSFTWWAILFSLIPVPLYFSFMKNPQSSNIKTVYRLVYFNLLFFAIIFAVLFWWFA